MRRLAVFFSIFMLALILLADLGYLRFFLYLITLVPYLDKFIHFIMVGTLTYLVTASLTEAYPDRNPFGIILAGVIFFAVVFTLEEVSQGPIRGRDFSWKDLAANYAGILFFGSLLWFQNRKRMHQTKPN